jgi:PAS domain S-box-containing protein
MQEGAVVISEEGTILYCNRSFEEMISKPMEKIVGSNFRQHLNRNERQKFNEIILEKTGERVSTESIHFDSAGKARYFHLSICPMPEDVLGKFCVIITDITEIKKFQDDLHSLVEERTIDLQEAIAKLQESNAIKDKLFSIIAHDLKGPFTALLGFSELLTEGGSKYDTGQFEMMINNIHMAAKNAYALLENLLLWAMSRNKQLQFNPEEVNFTEIIADVVKNQKVLATMKNISLNFQAQQDIWGYGDLNMLKAVVRNLLANAIKFTNHGGNVNLSMETQRNTVKINITDDGMGMSEETVSSLLQSGTSKPVSGTAYEKGTGLGLVICAEFVKKHNGKIEIASEYGKGSTFTVILPITKQLQSEKTDSNMLHSSRTS